MGFTTDEDTFAWKRKLVQFVMSLACSLSSKDSPRNRGFQATRDKFPSVFLKDKFSRPNF